MLCYHMIHCKGLGNIFENNSVNENTFCSIVQLFMHFTYANFKNMDTARSHRTLLGHVHVQHRCL